MTEVPAAPLRLAEVQWTFRRVFSWGLVLLLLILVAVCIFRMTDARSLMWVAVAALGVIALQSVLYTAGATVTDIARLVAAMRTFQVRFGRADREGPPC